MAGSVVSRACSETTIGAGDVTNYWDFCHRMVEVKDLGHRYLFHYISLVVFARHSLMSLVLLTAAGNARNPLQSSAIH
jgi:hypothetical protein